jgi:sugar/nucleoside kinase (ribokinase family)
LSDDLAVVSTPSPWSARHYDRLSPTEREEVVSVNGAGDCFAAAFVTAALAGRRQDCAVAAGLQAAAKSVVVAKAVPHDLTSKDIDWERSAPGVDIVRL